MAFLTVFTLTISTIIVLLRVIPIIRFARLGPAIGLKHFTYNWYFVYSSVLWHATPSFPCVASMIYATKGSLEEALDMHLITLGLLILSEWMVIQVHKKNWTTVIVVTILVVAGQSCAVLVYENYSPAGTLLSSVFDLILFIHGVHSKGKRYDQGSLQSTTQALSSSPAWESSFILSMILTIVALVVSMMHDHVPLLLRHPFMLTSLAHHYGYRVLIVHMAGGFGNIVEPGVSSNFSSIRTGPGRSSLRSAADSSGYKRSKNASRNPLVDKSPVPGLDFPEPARLQAV